MAAGSSSNQPARETEKTASLNNQGIVSLQQQMMTGLILSITIDEFIDLGSLSSYYESMTD